nr:hypothetical protein [Tanacetum cinerariifolium]
MRYEHPNTTPKTESDEIIKSGVEELVPIISENEVTLEDKRELTTMIFEDIEYVKASLPDPEIVSLKEENVVHQEEEEIDLEDISQIQDVVLREKLLSINRLIANIESLNDNPTPDCVLNSFVSIPTFEESDNSLSDNFLPEFETFCDHMEDTRSGNTITHADDSLPEYDSFCFKIEPDQERLINIVKNDISDDSSNDPLLEEADLFLASDNSILPGIEYFAYDSEGDICFLKALLIDDSIPFPINESSEFDFDNPSFPRPPPKPRDADFEPDSEEEIPVVMNDNDELECLNLRYEFKNDDYFPFMFVIRIFMPYLICSKVFSFLLSTESEDTILTLVSPFRASDKLIDITKKLSLSYGSLFKLGIQHAQPEDSNELFQKLLEDLKELAEYVNSPSRDHPIFFDDNEEHYVQNKEYLENHSNEIAASNSNQEKEKPPQDSDIRQLIREECCIEVYEIIKSGVEELVPILSENEVTSEDKRECDTPVCENSPICNNYSEIFSDSNNNDDISSDNDDFEDIEYVEASLLNPEIVSLEEENVVHQEEEEIDLEDISQIQDVVLREKLLSINCHIANIKSLNDNPTPDCVLNSFVSIPTFEESDNSLSDNFLPEFKTFCNHTEETRSGNTITHADDSLPEYDSFCFEIEPDQERLINIVKNDISDDSSNDPLLEEADLFLASDNSIPPGIENFAYDSEGDIRFREALLIDDSIPFPVNESSEFDFDNPSFPRPPPEPPDADFEPDSEEEIPVEMNDNDELECLNPRDEFENDDYFPFMFVIRIFMPYLICSKEPSYNQNYNDNYYSQDSPSFSCCDNCRESHETFQCQPMDQNIDFFGSDQIQTPQYHDVHPSSQEIRDEVFHAKGDLMKSIQTFLEEFNCIPFEEKPKILLQAWYKFFAIQHAQPEDSNELFQKLLEDLKELAEYVNSPSRDHFIFFDDNEDPSVQNKEYLENHSDEIAASNSNQEKEKPPQDSDICRLIREECYIEVCEEQKQKMENTILELVEICRQKELFCMHDNVDDLIESALNSKLLSINFQRLDKKKQEVKNVVKQPTEHETRIIESLQNFRIIHKSSTSLKNSSQISPIHAVAPILSTKVPEYSPSMRYEHPNTTLKTESDEIIKSGVEELVPILSENEVTSEDKRECDMPVCENSPICNNNSKIFSDSNNDDDISSDDDDFEDIEYVEASLPGLEIISLEEENVVHQEEEEIDLEDISQIQDVVLREKLLSINRLIANIESLNDNPTPDCVLNSSVSIPTFEEFDNSLSDNFLPEFKTFCDHTEETRSEEADLFLALDNSIPLGIENFAYDSEGDIHFLEALLIDDSIPFPVNESSEFDFDNPSFPRPHLEPPDADFEPDSEEEIPVVMNDNDELECLNPRDEFENDDYFPFMFVIRIFMPYLICSKVFYFLLSTKSEDTIFDPGIFV